MTQTLPATPTYLRQTAPGVWRLEVWAQPGAARNGLAGEYQGRLKIKIDAPAVDNKANEALVDYLAGLFGLRKSAVTLDSGASGRKKTFFIHTVEEPAGVIARVG